MGVFLTLAAPIRSQGGDGPLMAQRGRAVGTRRTPKITTKRSPVLPPGGWGEKNGGSPLFRRGANSKFRESKKFLGRQNRSRILYAKNRLTTSVNRPLSSRDLRATVAAPGRARQQLWDRVASEYDISDASGVEMLTLACEATDRIQALSARIREDGETVRTPAGIRAHPLLKEELAARGFVVRTLQRLGLNFEPVRGMGRPPGRRVV
jgi:hypothetical protein